MVIGSNICFIPNKCQDSELTIKEQKFSLTGDQRAEGIARRGAKSHQRHDQQQRRRRQQGVLSPHQGGRHV